MIYGEDKVALVSIILDRITYEDRANIDKRVLNHKFCGELYPIVQREFDYLCLKLQARIWAETIQNETVVLAVDYPSSLWQHFKQVAFPQWALKKWPVKLVKKEAKHTFRTVALMPEFSYKPASTEFGKVIIKTIVNKE